MAQRRVQNTDSEAKLPEEYEWESSGRLVDFSASQFSFLQMVCNEE